MVLNGINGQDYAGLSVSGAGDINGDGLDDLIIGAPSAEPEGQSYVVFGSEREFPASLDLADLNGIDGFALNGAPQTFNDRLVSGAGDVNGDGIDDLLLGNPRGNKQAGQSYVVFGNSSLPFNLIELPILSKNTSEIFTFSGVTGEDRLQFTLVESQAAFVNEIGVFVVDDEEGKINRIAPGEPGYLEAALDRAKVVFSALPNNGFPSLTYTRQLSFDARDRLGFLLVSNSTIDTVLTNLAAGHTVPDVFFATPTGNTDGFNHLQVSELETGEFTLAWEDLLGSGDADFNDLVLSVRGTEQASPLATGLQGEQDRELLDLRNQAGMVPAEFKAFGEAAYNNSVGLYVVENEQGTVRDPVTGQLIAPDAPSYAQIAIQQRLNLDLDRDTENLATQLEGGVLLAPYIIADGTPEQFLDTNPDNQEAGTLAYFAYLGANPDRIDHLRLLGDNTFGFEDLYGGGDLDYNDLVFQVDL